jgi:hypothetical protein
VRDGNMVLLKVLPARDPLRGDPRFGDLLRRMSLPVSPHAAAQVHPSSFGVITSALHCIGASHA